MAVARTGTLPVPSFAAGGIATPQDAALCRALGAEAIFVGSGVFLSEHPEATARAIVQATTHWDSPSHVLAAASSTGQPMPGQDAHHVAQRFAERGW